MATRSQKTISDKLASPRFISGMLGLSYSGTIAALHRNNIKRLGGGLRDLDEVRRLFQGKFLIGQAYDILRKRVDQHEAANSAVPVPKKDLAHLQAAWRAMGAPGSDMLIPGKGGKKAIGEELPAGQEAPIAWQMSPLAAEKLKLEQKKAAAQDARIQGHREVLRLRRAVADRLMGLMCDRAMVALGCRNAASVFSRFLNAMPARMVGRLKQVVQIDDARLRQIEDYLSEEIPNIVVEIEKEMAEAEAQAAAAAASTRYGAKNWTSENRIDAAAA